MPGPAPGHLPVLGERDAALGAGLTILLCGALSLTTCFLPPQTKEISPREGFLSVALCWVVVSLAGGLPFFFSGAIPNFIDCFFETVSGFTTTGSSILTDVEAMPKGLLYWRSFTHWLGGMGVLVFLLAVVPMGKGRNSLLHVMRAESPGPQVDKLVPTLQKSAKILYTIYIAMTLIQITLLLLGGMPLFDSLTISFGTAGTGGFAIKNDSMAGYSPYLQAVCTVFMALFGVNFSIYYLVLLRQFGKVLRNEELWTYLGIMAGAIVLITWDITPQFGGGRGPVAAPRGLPGVLHHDHHGLCHHGLQPVAPLLENDPGDADDRGGLRRVHRRGHQGGPGAAAVQVRPAEPEADHPAPAGGPGPRGRPAGGRERHPQHLQLHGVLQHHRHPLHAGGGIGRAVVGDHHHRGCSPA